MFVVTVTTRYILHAMAAAPEAINECDALVAWVRSAAPNLSFGALPKELQAYVQRTGLPELRSKVPPDVEERVACIKRREQNQRAFKERQAKRSRAEADMKLALTMSQLHVEMFASYCQTLRESRELREQADEASMFKLFSPPGAADQLFRGLEHGGAAHVRPAASAVQDEDDDGAETLRLLAEVLSVDAMDQAPG